MKSFIRLTDVVLGFTPQNVLTVAISLPHRQYSDSSQQMFFFDQILQRVRALPGTRSAAVADRLPPDGPLFGTRVSIVGRPLPALNDPTASILDVAVSPGYFETIGIPLLSGRSFTDEDGANTPNVVIVNEAFVRRFFSNGEDPLDEHILYGVGGSNPVSLSIVGVANDARNVGLAQKVEPEMFRPFTQSPKRMMYFLLRRTSDPKALIPLVQEQILALDKNQPIYDIQTMQEILGQDTAAERFDMAMMGFFAAVALTLAAVGVFGVVSYAVTQRTHEIGLRMALGAQRGHILWLVVGQGMVWALLGILTGVAGALALTRFLRGLLFDVRPTDPWVFIGAVALLTFIAFAACYIPARRAMRVDPMVALRDE